MISPEMIRRYPLSAGLTAEHLTVLAMAAEVQQVEEGHWFFRQDQELHDMYLVLEGQVGIVVLPRQVVVTNSVGPGDVFSWSAGATSRDDGQRARLDRVPRGAFRLPPHPRENLRSRPALRLPDDGENGQTVRQRLRDLRIEALHCLVA